jgi:hypothetical protein
MEARRPADCIGSALWRHRSMQLPLMSGLGFRPGIVARPGAIEASAKALGETK